MRIFYVILLIFSTLCGAFAQTIQDIEGQIKKANDDEKIKLLTKLAELYLPSSSKKAIENVNEAFRLINTQGADNKIKAKLNSILGTAYYSEHEYYKAITAYENELQIIQYSNLPEAVMNSSFNLAQLYKLLDNTGKALDYYEKSIDIAEQLGNGSVMIQNYNALYQLYFQANRFKEALEYYKKTMDIRDKQLNLVKVHEISMLQTEYASIKQQSLQNEQQLKSTEQSLTQTQQEKQHLQKTTVEKDQKIMVLDKETRAKDLIITQKEDLVRQQTQIAEQQAEIVSGQRKMIGLFIIFIVIVIGFLIVVYSQYHQKKKAYNFLEWQNNAIRKQKEEIQAQRDKISEQNNDITASIHYAQRIQNAMLPGSEVTDKLLQNYFVFFKPRDIVSGDFYWCAQIGFKVVVVAADCTGHGIPGAFMSMLGIAFLNDIVNKEKITDPDKILNQMRTQIIDALKQDEAQNKMREGMDIAVITIDRLVNRIEFAGANNPLLIVRKNEIIEINADRMPVGIYPKMKPFKKEIFMAEEDDTLYLFSDGYYDQFGGSNNKKFMYKRFKQQFLDIRYNTMQSQERKLEEIFEQWRGTHFQIDDLLIIGVRI